MRKTRITAFVLLLCMIISVVAVSLVSCGEAHKHTYSSDWSYDETSHWHVAICAHTTLIADKADHTFGSDGKCTVCGYESEKKDNPPAPHEHTYSDAWSADDTHHWHAATCEHIDEKKDYGEHNFVNGECTVCGKIDPTPHEHTFSDEWSHDANTHWHAATCEHKDQKKDEAAHTFEDGECTVCGEPDPNYVPPGHEHTYSDEWSSDDTNHWHAATCEHTNEKKDLGAHDIEWTTATPATCTAAGTKTGRCKVCGKTFTGTIPAIDHTYYPTYRVDMESHWKVCTSCGGETTHEAHTFGDDDKCTVCGKSKTETPPDYFTALPVKKEEIAL